VKNVNVKLARVTAVATVAKNKLNFKPKIA